MSIWTVVGYYDDNGDAYADHIEAGDAFDAMAAAARTSTSTELVIVGAVPGAHDLTTPGDDTGRTAFAADLAGEDADA